MSTNNAASPASPTVRGGFLGWFKRNERWLLSALSSLFMVTTGLTLRSIFPPSSLDGLLRVMAYVGAFVFLPLSLLIAWRSDTFSAEVYLRLVATCLFASVVIAIIRTFFT